MRWEGFVLSFQKQSGWGQVVAVFCFSLKLSSQEWPQDPEWWWAVGQTSEAALRTMATFAPHNSSTA